ncbi:unnamed protein product [Cochlearia groenlandica]
MNESEESKKTMKKKPYLMCYGEEENDREAISGEIAKRERNGLVFGQVGCVEAAVFKPKSGNNMMGLATKA